METTDYSGMFVYKDEHIDYINTSEGRLKWDAHNQLFYAEYFIKDHLGNVRDVITTNPNFSNPIIQVTDYYPFGLEIQDINASDNLQLYNSKELQTDAKLWWYDYGARFYDPVLARWHSVDPLTEKSRRWSPYSYCMNNPIRFIDPDGMNQTVYINGKEADQATKQLQSGTSLTISRNSENGKLSASGEAKTKKDKQLLAAINDVTIQVNINAENSNTTSTGGNFTGGAFLGNKVTENTTTEIMNNKPFETIEMPAGRTVIANQQVNPEILDKVDAYANQSGAGMMHETTEAYEGAKISQQSGISAQQARRGVENPIYKQAHKNASKQPAEYQTFMKQTSNGTIIYLGTEENVDVILRTIK